MSYQKLLTMCQNVNRLVVEIKETFNRSFGGQHPAVSRNNIRIEPKILRHLVNFEEPSILGMVQFLIRSQSGLWGAFCRSPLHELSMFVGGFCAVGINRTQVSGKSQSDTTAHFELSASGKVN